MPLSIPLYKARHFACVNIPNVMCTDIDYVMYHLVKYNNCGAGCSTPAPRNLVTVKCCGAGGVQGTPAIGSVPVQSANEGNKGYLFP